MRRPLAVLSTHEDPERVRGLLALPKVELDRSPNALCSMLRMAQAECVIASRSTFSMWGVFLGDCQAIWDANFDLASAFPIREGRDYFL